MDALRKLRFLTEESFVQFFVLEADEHLTKTIRKDGVDPYPHVLNFTSHSFNAATLQAFSTKLQAHADKGHCLIKGVLHRELFNEPRRGATDPQDPTQWVCLDFDGYETKSVDAALKDLGFNADYVIQYSASSGFKPGLRAHVFFFLSAPTSPALLKLWLKHLNLSHPAVQAQLTLNRAGTTLRWPIDITACQNDKLLYIAPPVLDGVKPAHTGPRIQFVKGSTRTLTLDFEELRAEALHQKELAALNRLRTAAGLKTRKAEKLVTVGSVEVLKNPGRATVTGERRQRGFVYLNLNNGDSWGYYYPENDSSVLFNFKGEPNYLLKELCPEYSPLLPEASNDIDSGECHYLAVLNKRDDQYYVGTYDTASQTLDLRPTGSIKKVHDFLKQHGQYVPDYIPEWELSYDFQSDFSIDFDIKRINLYRMSPYMRGAKKAQKPPAFIHSIVCHVLGNDDAIVEHFYNWLAVVCQRRIKTMTAWVMSGTEGTGKGLLFHKVLTPIIGPDYCRMVQLRVFEKEFNAFIESSLLIMVNESEVSAVDKDRTKVMAAIKELITDPVVSVRRMHVDHYRADNVANFILASNKYDAIEIAPNDRRFNAAPRQENKFEYPKSQIEPKVAVELQDFANYIMFRPADENLAQSIIGTAERAKLQELTVAGPEQVATALKKGDIDFFWDNRPDREDPVTLELRTNLELPKYADILTFMFKNAGGMTNFPRNWAVVLFHYLTGISFASSYKFTKFIGHKGLEVKPVYWEGEITRGIANVTWKCSATSFNEWERSWKVTELPAAKKARKKA